MVKVSHTFLKGSKRHSFFSHFLLDWFDFWVTQRWFLSA